MRIPDLRQLLLACAMAAGLAACDNNDSYVGPEPTPAPNAPIATAGDTYVLTTSNRLVTFNRATPSTTIGAVALTGLLAGENILGIDFRPADGMLYGLGSSGRIYLLDRSTGAATVRSVLTADVADTTDTFGGLAGSAFGMDFNPAVDRLRVVSNTGQNLRINVDTGATTTDGAINGATASISAVAYSNGFAGTTATQLFSLDAVGGMLYLQNPPNNGTLTTPFPLGLSAQSVNGFDIDGRNNIAYAVFTVAGVRGLYQFTMSGPPALLGTLNVQEDIRGLAIPVPAATVYAMTAELRLVSFKPATPNTLESNVAMSGLPAADRLLGIDVRPANGTMYALSTAGRLYTVNLTTGALTAGALLSADPSDTTAPYAGLNGAEFAIDFNPVADRLRVISNTGQNLRINVDTGATTTDGTINRAGAMPVVGAAAYTNSFAGATATTLFDIDSASDSLAAQNPPNDGTLANIGALGIDTNGGGFDIAGGANGLALAALRLPLVSPPVQGTVFTPPPTALYRIDLVTGAATLVTGNAMTSIIGSSSTPPIVDIAIVLR